MFFKSKEAGKAISTSNMKRIQDIHDNTTSLGAGCSYGGMSLGGGIYESDPARMTEAALPMNTSHDALRGHVQKALSTVLGVKDHWAENGPWVHYNGMFPQHVIYDHAGQTYKHKYSVNYGAAGSDPEIKFSGTPTKVHTAYVDSKDNGDKSGESMSFLTDVPADWEETKERFIFKAKLDEADEKDFAGKGKSFPILEAGDVEIALKSIGRAGSGNHDAATLKKNILSIAKRKGFAVPSSDKRESVSITLQDGEILVSEGVAIEMVKEGSKISALPKPIDVKIIAPGWGSMAYYSKEMIQESGPGAFQKGTQMFWNHATNTQEAERPEGDLNDLAAILTENAKWQDNGPKGPGLYAKAKVFSDYAQQVAEKGPHIGVSINAGIKCHEGEAEGKSGRIADKFVHAFSADFVTKAGAGGAPIVPVTESNRGQLSGKESTMTEQETKDFKELQEKMKLLESDNAKLREGQNVVLAVATVGAVLQEAGIPFSTKVLERVCQNPTMKDGKVEEAWVKQVASEFAEGITGRVTGMGHVRESATTTEKLTEAETKEFSATLAELGVPEAGLKIALGR